MQLKIKTQKLQEMMTSAVKGASNNKLIPLTGMLCIKLENNKLTLVTTDGKNYLYVTEDKVEGEDFYIVINIDIFSKLVSKLTTEYTTLTLQETKLLVSANGEYVIELPLDENGSLITFPDPISELSYEDSDLIDLSQDIIRKLLTAGKASIATTLEVPCYTGYYLGNKIVTTNRSKICGIDVNVLKSDTPALWNPEMVDLLSILKDPVVKVWQGVDRVILKDSHTLVYSNVLDGVESYQIDAIDFLLQDSFENKAVMPRDALLNVLDRLTLFIGPYDNNSIKLTFTDKELQISSKETTGSETVPYTNESSNSLFTCNVDIETLISQIKSIQAEEFTIHWGKDNAIKLSYDNITHIIALLED